ncbi:MAG: hypothetical protein HY073_01035 [Deltaproteobacteria bacterium]|nr:hypothetical protein [Deltaproteobacteria bacterium]
MRKISAIFFLLVFLILPSAYSQESAGSHKQKEKREILLRVGPRFGTVAKLDPVVLDTAVERFITVFPDGNLDVQIAGRWFGSLSFAYARVRGKLALGNANVYAPTAGVKLISSWGNAGSGDFFDDSRWWCGLELGPYITNLSDAMTGALPGLPKTKADFGFNVGAGFDYFFHEHWATGIEVKIHYVSYSPDDYVLVSFGPHLTARF